jgi:hypothetical protein
MSEQTERQILVQLLGRVRRRILIQTSARWYLRACLVALPLASVLIAADQRWNQGRSSLAVAAIALLVPAVLALLIGQRGLGERVRSALTLDQQANLKDRISSAWEFLEQPRLGEAQQVQIRDAIRHAESLNCSTALRMVWPRFTAVLPLLAILFVLSFLVPSLTPRTLANLAKDPIKQEQLARLEELKQDLASKENLPEELQEMIKKLDEVKRQFEKGEIGERDVMLELGRLDENLRARISQMGVENLESEMNALVPHLSANAATLPMAQAMKEQKLDKAAEELKDLANKVSDEKVSKEEQKKLAAQLGTAAAKLGKKNSSDSFGGDLAQASESLEKSDSEGFKSACKNMGEKLGLLSKCKNLGLACNKLGLCKAGLGQCESKEMGYKLGPQTLSKGKGGLKAGTSTAGDPLADPSRLADGYKKMVQISGQAGQGPVETETEVTEGQMSKSQLSAREVHASYAAAAEEVIEKEDIPLSQRYHVKRYFQAIRPQE